MTPAARRHAFWALCPVFVPYGGTIPFNFSGDAGALAERWRALPPSPFISPDTGRRLSIPDVVQNILLFLPFGALGVASAGARARWTWTRIAWVTAIGAAFSCLIEGLQLLTWDRVASTADVMTTTAGTFAGGVALRLFGRTGEMVVVRLRLEGMTGVDELRMLGVATAAIAVAYLQPFDVTLEVGGVVGHGRAFQRDLWQFGALRDEGLMVLLATLFAMTIASYFSAIGERHAGRKAAIAGIIGVVLFESAQFLIVSRLPSL